MESEVRKKPTRGHWPNHYKFRNFLDTVYPDGKIVDVYRHWEMCCGSTIFFVAVVHGLSTNDVREYQIGVDTRGRLEAANLHAVIEVCTREHLI